jgi:hypothetical protein
MVNRSLEDLIVSAHGEDAWERVKRRAGIDVDVFISHEGYPDALTYALVVAAAHELQTSTEQLLENFGEHWVMKTALHSYGELMHSGGRSVQEFLLQLPTFHSRVALMFPHLAPPEFECSDLTSSSLCLHYRSRRPGLAHFVIGLVRGIGRMFDASVTVHHRQRRDDGADHDVFEVMW